MLFFVEAASFLVPSIVNWAPLLLIPLALGASAALWLGAAARISVWSHPDRIVYRPPLGQSKSVQREQIDRVALRGAIGPNRFNHEALLVDQDGHVLLSVFADYFSKKTLAEFFSSARIPVTRGFSQWQFTVFGIREVTDDTNEGKHEL
jgi:hypothetical protein